MRLIPQRILPWRIQPARPLTTTPSRPAIRDIAELPVRVQPSYIPAPINTLLSLQWPSPPRNILVTKKQRTPNITQSVIEFTTYIRSTYPGINILFVPETADELHSKLPFDVYTYDRTAAISRDLLGKTDLICTLGGDGTLLRASSLFRHADSVPPVLSFAMGTIGFLGEFKFTAYKRAFREVYMSGALDAYPDLSDAADEESLNSLKMMHDPLEKPLRYADVRGQAGATSRAARVLLRNRLKVGVFAPNGQRIGGNGREGDTYALNEVTLHRGSSPHLKIIDVYINHHFLTEAVADGMIISTPTGSTAYSLSSGGSIVHPLVPSLLLTPICPRSLSFRPLVLPAETPITLRLGEKNRGREVEVSIDGKTITEKMGVGMEVRVAGEQIRKMDAGWEGGVPSIVRGTTGRESIAEDHWVGGLNALLKFNYPFGEHDS